MSAVRSKWATPPVQPSNSAGESVLEISALAEESVLGDSASAEESGLEQRPRRSGMSTGEKETALAIMAVTLRRKLSKAVLQLCSQEAKLTTDKVERYLTAKFTIIFFRTLHLALSFICFQHFFYIKFRKQEAGVPELAPNYWYKRLVPSFEFGAMHSILFQLAIIPLTMSRKIQATMSTGPLGKLLPFMHVTTLHIHIGYAFCIQIVVTVGVFVWFFGKVCRDHLDGLDPLDTCEKFTSEIMITGWLIFFVVLVIMASSYFRSRISYELFYVTHHFVFIMFGLALVHTLDKEFREGSTVGKARSQTAFWFGWSLVIYLTDRIWLNVTAFRKVPTTAELSKDGASLVLRCQKPRDFSFVAGQHAFIQAPRLDAYWHPFSIGSDPAADELLFFIEVKKPGSWTARLAKYVKANPHGMRLNLQGPCGHPVADLETVEEVVCVGTGTGIVPMLSLLHSRAERLALLGTGAIDAIYNARAKDANDHGHEQELLHERLKDGTIQMHEDVQMVLDATFASGKRNSVHVEKESFAAQATEYQANFALVARVLQLKFRLSEVKKKGMNSAYIRRLRSNVATNERHWVIDMFSMLLMLFELMLLGFSLSWSNLPATAPPTEWMIDFLRYGTLAALVSYGVVITYHFIEPIRYGRSAGDLLNLILVVATGIFCERRWSFSAPTFWELGFRSILHLWRVYRLMRETPMFADHAMVERRKRTGYGKTGQLMGAEGFHFIWVDRSADLIMGYLPEFMQIVSRLQEELQMKKFSEFMKIQIFCTDSNPVRADTLKKMVNGTPLQEMVSFGRPNLPELIVGVMHRQLNTAISTRAVAKDDCRHTLVTFCGSPLVAKTCWKAIHSANLLAAALGMHGFQFAFREEFYGIVAGGAPPKANAKSAPPKANAKSDAASPKDDEESDASGEQTI